jgi:hypothetical protein
VTEMVHDHVEFGYDNRIAHVAAGVHMREDKLGVVGPPLGNEPRGGHGSAEYVTDPQEREDDDADDGEDGLERRGCPPRPGRVPLAGPERNAGRKQRTDAAWVSRLLRKIALLVEILQDCHAPGAPLGRERLSEVYRGRNAPPSTRLGLARRGR